MAPTLSGNTRVVAARDQIFSDLGGEIVLLNVASGVYHGLDEVGARVWHLIQQPRTVGEIRDAILTEYEVAPEQCERDVMTLLQQLVQAGLANYADGAYS